MGSDKPSAVGFPQNSGLIVHSPERGQHQYRYNFENAQSTNKLSNSRETQLLSSLLLFQLTNFQKTAFLDISSLKPLLHCRTETPESDFADVQRSLTEHVRKRTKYLILGKKSKYRTSISGLTNSEITKIPSLFPKILCE